jgi:hypothetical protein
LAAAVWLGLVILGAALGGSDSFAGRLGNKLVDTAAPIVFAIAGGSALLEVWQRREWRQHTQFVAFDAFEHALNALARVAAEVHTTLAIAFSEADRNARLSITEAFRLPFSHAQNSVWAEAMVPVDTLVEALRADHGRAREHVNRHRRARLDAQQARADAMLREAYESISKLRQDPNLAELFPEPTGKPYRARPATELATGDAADTAAVPPDVVRDLLNGARERAKSIVGAVDEMHARFVDASAFAGRQSTQLVTDSLELRARALAVAVAVAVASEHADELDDGTDRTERYERDTGQAHTLASRGLVALAECYRALYGLGTVFDHLRRDTRRHLPEELQAVQARSELVDALIAGSVALRLRSEQLRRSLRD